MLRLSTVSVLAALLITGCGGGTSSTSSSSSDQPTSSSSTAAAEQEDTSASDDVKITKCDNATWTQTVGLEVTNSTSKPWKYVVGVTIKDASGAESEARFVKNTIEPGKTLTEEIPGGNPDLKGEITCELAEAKRLPAQ